ncbi:MAG TPA: lipoate--protein ligase family protein [Gemmatimonadaceae bacterium]|nr:lipoate--protein ligase family protein [Gemmatimonadaceae bacterium]
MTAWRLLDTGPLEGAVNMAFDVALMERARTTGERVFRVYGWDRPTLSLGRNQVARDRYDLTRLQQKMVDVVRRPTGGRAILHWRELTYSVTAPIESMSAARSMYASINEIILRTFQRLGIEAEVVRSHTKRRPDEHPCFAEPGDGEIVAHVPAGRGKLVGSAQYVENGALLQHGSILLQDDQPILLELTEGGAARTQAASVSAALGRDASRSEVADALLDTVRLSADGRAGVLDMEQVRAQADTHLPLFRDPLWTWRR